MRVSSWVVMGVLAGGLLGCGSSDDGDGAGGTGAGGTGAGGSSGAGPSAGSGNRGGAGSGGASGGASSGAPGTGGAGSTTCGATPCGGDVVGTWDIAQSCFDQGTTADPDCPGGTVTIANARQTGTVTFTAGGTYTSSGTFSADITQSTPLSCITAGGGSCELLAFAFQALGGGCTTEGTNCVCTASLDDEPASGAGSYSASGSTLALTPTGGELTSNPYCVQGSTLHLHSDGTSSAMMGTAAGLGGDLVLNRR